MKSTVLTKIYNRNVAMFVLCVWPKVRVRCARAALTLSMAAVKSLEYRQWPAAMGRNVGVEKYMWRTLYL